MYGTLVGAVLGLVFLKGMPGMFVGAILGFYATRLFRGRSKQLGGRGMNSSLSGSDALGVLGEEQSAFFVCTFSLLAKLTKADGTISKEEIQAIEMVMKKQMFLNRRMRKLAIDIFRGALESPLSFEDYTERFYRTFSRRPNMLGLILDVLLTVSIADGELSSNEDSLIRYAAKTFGFTDTQYEALRRQYSTIGSGAPSERNYAVLGVTMKSSDEEIKKAYRKLVSEYHPDKVIGAGLPKDFVEFAHDKFKEIQLAYESIKKERKL